MLQQKFQPSSRLPKHQFFKNKVASLGEITDETHINFLFIDETKLDDYFPDSNLELMNINFHYLEGTRTTREKIKYFLLTIGLLQIY